MSDAERESDTLREQAPPSVARDMGITVLFLLVSGAFLVLSEQFAGDRISEYDPGASFWPRATLLVIAVAGLLNLLLLYRRARERGEPVIPSTNSLSEVVDFSEKQKQYLMAIALSAVFFLSLYYIGFFIASPIFLFVFAYVIGYREIGKLTVFSVVVALLIFFTFRNVMNVALPYGMGPFREISIWAANLF